MNYPTAIPNVSMPCLVNNPPPPCICPTQPGGGVYLPVQNPDGSWVCWLALPSPPVSIPAPVPSLSEWALVALGLALALVAVWRLR